MPAITEQGSPSAQTARIEVLLNFCRTVVRSDEDLLKDAMGQYQRYLAAQARG